MTGGDEHGEAGFTLIELVVAMFVTVVVVLGSLGALDAFRSEATLQTRVTDAGDRVRATMDRVVLDLRGASTVLRAESSDLVYAVPEPAGVRVERVCVAAGRLYAATTTATTATLPAGACSTGSPVATLPATTDTAFSYDGAATSATPATVKNVGLAFGLDASGGGRTGARALRASAAVRRTAARVPIDDGDVVISCSQDGPLVQVGGGIAGDPTLGPLTVSYTSDTNVTVPGGTLDVEDPTLPVAVPGGATAITAIITDASGVVRGTLRKLVPCVQ